MVDVNADETPYLSDYYDLIHRGNPGDVRFYYQRSGGARRVLELGCGTGRITLALLKTGAQIVGLDNSPQMVAALNRKNQSLPKADRVRLRISLSDMAEFSEAGRFDRVLIPYNGLFCLKSDAAFKSCLACVYDHLEPGGKLLFDVYIFDEADEIEPAADGEFEFLTEVVRDGQKIDVFERYAIGAGTRNIEAQYLYRLADGPERGEELLFSIRHHYLYLNDIVCHLQEIGFVDIQIRSGFADEPISAEAEIAVVTAAR